MILLLQLFALYTLHCYAAYSLLLLPYDPPPTSSAPYTRYCTMPGVGGGGGGQILLKIHITVTLLQVQPAHLLTSLLLQQICTVCLEDLIWKFELKKTSTLLHF
jgi:hypothetical protein